MERILLWRKEDKPLIKSKRHLLRKKRILKMFRIQHLKQIMKNQKIIIGTKIKILLCNIIHIYQKYFSELDKCSDGIYKAEFFDAVNKKVFYREEELFEDSVKEKVFTAYQEAYFDCMQNHLSENDMMKKYFRLSSP